MSKKNFVMINTNLLECRRFRRLETCCQRNAYFTSLLSSRANYIGLFHFPMWMLAQEADVQPEETMPLIESLQDVGLIAYDQDDEMIRHIEWFYSSNISLSENTVKRAAKDFLDRRVPRTDFVGKAIAEFVVAALLDVRAYNSTSRHGEVVTEELRSFLVAATPLYPNLEALLVEEIRLNGTAIQRCFEDLYLGIIEGECNAERLTRGAADKPIGGPQEVATKHVTKLIPDSNQIHTKQRSNDDPDGGSSRTEPLPETVASKIAQSALARHRDSR